MYRQYNKRDWEQAELAESVFGFVDSVFGFVDSVSGFVDRYFSCLNVIECLLLILNC